jgi:hypothetical protein
MPYNSTIPYLNPKRSSQILFDSWSKESQNRFNPPTDIMQVQQFMFLEIEMQAYKLTSS